MASMAFLCVTSSTVMTLSCDSQDSNPEAFRPSTCTSLCIVCSRAGPSHSLITSGMSLGITTLEGRASEASSDTLISTAFLSSRYFMGCSPFALPLTTVSLHATTSDTSTRQAAKYVSPGVSLSPSTPVSSSLSGTSGVYISTRTILPPIFQPLKLHPLGGGASLCAAPALVCATTCWTTPSDSNSSSFSRSVVIPSSSSSPFGVSLRETASISPSCSSLSVQSCMMSSPLSQRRTLNTSG
mmetsp:Transcript_4195/g.9533  ORF Transcript_4195/g.9533 Transcript_4195/m.9533 type:complete len:241 (-) Transcript_4195:191-913(-)